MNIIIIEKNETIIEKNVKSFDLDKLYTICGYRSNKDFQKLYEWEFDKNIYELYGKKNGKGDKENKYTFPIEKDRHKDKDKDKLDKYYGTLCVIKKNGSITLDEWNIFYMSFTTKDCKNIDIDNDIDHDNDNDNHDDETNHTKYLDDELTYEEYEEE
jgi:hypothetical protein